MHILVIYGGVGAEREVSLCSGARVCEALQRTGHEVQGIVVDTPMPDAALLEKAKN
jgi:D-alanine-D-alanine ligase-like ATP-grasp enzyme